MSLTFARMVAARGSDILEEYFQLSREAEERRALETQAAVVVQTYWRRYLCRTYIMNLTSVTIRIQKLWRGFRVRLQNNKRVSEFNQRMRMGHYHKMATKIQKVWRGHLSRKNKFDFRVRKRYIQDIANKMANFRLSLKNHEQKQRQTAALMKAQKRMVLIEKLAGQRHHLLGTISNPGIYTNKPKSPPVKVRQADELSSGKAPIIIPEIQIRENPELKKYVAVNLKKSRMEVLRKHVEEEPAPELAQKAAQGPFLPKYAMLKKRLKPLKPTLRVQTDFYDTLHHKREEKRLELLQRVPDEIFTTAHIPSPPQDYFLKAEPYQMPRYGRLYFRETEPLKRIGKRDFKRIVKVSEGFDE